MLEAIRSIDLKKYRHEFWLDYCDILSIRLLDSNAEEVHGIEFQNPEKIVSQKQVARRDLLSQMQEPVARVEVTFDRERLSNEQIDAVISALTSLLTEDYRVLYELLSMTDELSTRYDELNLVYQTGGQSQDILSEKRQIEDLLNRCAEYLRIPKVSLISQPRKLSLSSGGTQLSEIDDNEMYGRLNEVLQRVRETGRSQIDSIELKTNAGGIPKIFKVLATQITNGKQDCIGAIFFIKNANDEDYTNSDRNLLEVISLNASRMLMLNYDQSTGLLKRKQFEAVVSRYMHGAEVQQGQSTLLLVDISRLQVLNESVSYEAGDLLIRSIGELLNEHVSTDCTMAYLDGGKYGCFLNRSSTEDAVRFANHISDEINSLKLQWCGRELEFSVTIGVAEFDANLQDCSQAITNAEVAASTLSLKDSNKVVVFSQMDQSMSTKKNAMLWVTKIQTALYQNKFVLYQQHIKPFDSDLHSDHYEILIRLEEHGKILSPFEFMPAAEYYNLMPLIDRWVIHSSFEYLSMRFNTGANDASIWSINLSGQTLSEHSLLEYVRTQLESFAIPPSNICFEITETAAIDDIDNALHIIDGIRQLGCSFALDDFGAGLSSFSYLKQLPVDYVKIDGFFVKDILTDPVSEAMVLAINNVSHVMGIKTVAEFVENTEIADKLNEMGIDFCQGYGIAKPGPLPDCAG